MDVLKFVVCADTNRVFMGSPQALMMPVRQKECPLLAKAPTVVKRLIKPTWRKLQMKIQKFQ